VPSHKHVALIINANKYYDRGIVKGVADYARKTGRWSVYFEDDPLTKTPNLRAWAGDGIIADLEDEAVVKAIAGVKAPVVGIAGGGGVAARAKVSYYVDSDDRQIGRLAADHLLERGFRRFAYVGLPRTPINPWVHARQQAFVEHVDAAGCDCSVFIGRFRTARRWEALQKEMVAWLKKLRPPIGLMACDDLRARHVLEACRRARISVPEAIAVIGVDNDELVCDLAAPPLSSVVQNTHGIGAEAAALLDQLMRGRRPKSKWRIVPPLSVACRQSTDITTMEDTLVATAVRFIRENVSRRIQVDDVLDHVAVSRTGLDQRFKQQLGRTVHQEIDRVRLKLARELLRSTDLPLDAIAARAGYIHAQYMSAVFRRSLGRTPGQDRAMAMD
jgi:LacI family transcriptional regulator